MISIIDYGLGNIIAFVSAYQRLGIGCEIVSNTEDLKKAEWYEKRLTKFMEDHDVLGQKG